MKGQKELSESHMQDKRVSSSSTKGRDEIAKKNANKTGSNNVIYYLFHLFISLYESRKPSVSGYRCVLLCVILLCIIQTS